MASSSNADTMKSFYESWSKGDLDTIKSLLSSDITWHIMGEDIINNYRGQDEVGTLLEKFSDASITFDLDTIEANDYFSFSLATITGSHLGRELNNEPCALTASIHNGKISDLWMMCHDQSAWNEFFSEAKEMQA